MASFTDQISQFNPYIQELPVEEMVKVGMYKQQQYDAGVQKIQSYVDNIAGLAVSKPQHKQYVQSQLNELGNKLKIVAAADFSNQQLVNSVGGMAGKILKDPIVQNAVYSTKIIQKGYQDMEAARKAGKSSKDNEDYYESKIAEWYSNPDLKTPFSGNFTQFKDVNKKLVELGDNLKKNAPEFSIDQPFMRNEKGETLYFKTIKVKDKAGKEVNQTVASTDPSQGGEKRLDLDMLRTKVKGVTAQKILSTFRDSLDSNDIEQLKINSWARYRGATAQTFKNDIAEGYKAAKGILNQEIVDLATTLQNPNLSSKEKSDLKVLLEQKTKEFNSGNLEKAMEAEMAEVETNIKKTGLDEFKYKIYANQYLSSLARDLSNRSYEEERVANPARAADLAQQKFQLDQLQFQDDSRYKWAKYNLDVEANVRAREKHRAEMKLLQPTTFTDVREGTVATGSSVPTFKTERENLQALLQQKANLQSEYGQTLFGKGLTPSQLGESFANLEADYRANPSMGLTKDQASYLNKVKAIDNETSISINLQTASMKSADAKVVKEAIAKSGVKPITFSNGQVISPEEVSEILPELRKFERVTGSGGYQGGGYVTTAFDSKAAQDYFRNYKGGKYSNAANIFIKGRTNQTLTAPEQQVIKTYSGFSKALEKSANNYEDYQNEFIASNSPKFISQKATLSPDLVKADEAALDKFISRYTDRYATLDKKPSSGNPTTIGQWWNSRGSGSDKGGKVNWTFEKFDDGTGQVVVTKGGQTEIMKATAEDIADYFPQATQTSAFNPIKRTINISPSKTTNLADDRTTNPYNAVTARFSGNDLPQLKGVKEAPLFRYDIEGEIGNTGRETDKYSLIGYVKDPKTDTWKRKELHPGYVGEGKIVDILNRFSGNNILEAIKTWK
jgi:hypothetical protein